MHRRDEAEPRSHMVLEILHSFILHHALTENLRLRPLAGSVVSDLPTHQNAGETALRLGLLSRIKNAVDLRVEGSVREVPEQQE